MNKQIFLDGKVSTFSMSDLPMLIHGADGNGASLFSITMATNFFRQGFNILFMSGYHMARDEFREQTLAEDSILLNDEAMVDEALRSRVVFVSKERPELFLEVMKRTVNVEGWVVFLKNIELLDATILESILENKDVILAGDVDRCTFDLGAYIDNVSTKIVFTNSDTNPELSIPNLPKYSGVFIGSAKTGQVTVG